MDTFFEIIFPDSSWLKWGMAASISAISFFCIKIFKSVIIKKLKKWALTTRTGWDDFAIGVVEKSVIPLLYISSWYWAILCLGFNGPAAKAIQTAYLFSFTFFTLKIISAALKEFIYSFIQREEDKQNKEKQAGGLIAILNIIVWICGIIFLIDNMGYNVTTLIAGLGVGGIAIALAAQTVLGDLFSYFVIFFDRPFEIGDYVSLGADSGIIEYIGIKTTRIRTLSGEQLVCSNTDLTNSRLHNYKRMEKRRVLFHLGVTYNTPAEQLSKIPEIVKGIIAVRPELQYDRGHFSAFGEFSLNFEFVYFVNSPDYSLYMEYQQAIYLDIYTAFEEQKIDFAFPTQTLVISRQTNVPPANAAAHPH